VRFGRVVPVLRIFDVDKARDFYLSFLGFDIDWEHRFGDNFPLYLQISGNGCILHLTEHHGDCCPGAALRIETTGLDAFHAMLAAKDYRYMKPCIENMPWGSRDMTVTDPFGNRLTFTESVPDQPA
jgi:uncharacterized glyoxalase superfamily protein PhnB